MEEIEDIDEIDELKENFRSSEWALDIYENVKVRAIRIFLVVLSEVGVFIFFRLPDVSEDDGWALNMAQMPGTDLRMRHSAATITTQYHLPNKKYFFALCEDEWLCLDPDTDEVLHDEDLSRLFYNHIDPDSDYMMGKCPVSEKRLDLIRKCIKAEKPKEAIQQEPVRGFGHRQYITIDGLTYVLLSDRFGRNLYVPVNETVDPDEYLKLCVFGGFLGIHKFHDGRIFTGLLYALTGGIFGIGFLLDALMILLGTYRFKDGSCIGKVVDVKKAVLCFLICIVIAFAAVFAVIRIYTAISTGILDAANSEAVRNAVSDTIRNHSELYESDSVIS